LRAFVVINEQGGFSLLEVMLSIALSVMLIVFAFDLNYRFCSFFRTLETKGQSNCLCYTALQVLRTDLDGAPREKSTYKNISPYHIHFYLSDESSLAWQFNEKKHNLKRTHFYTKNAQLTKDKSVVLENIADFLFQVKSNSEFIDCITISLTHNGRLIQTSIKLRNRNL